MRTDFRRTDADPVLSGSPRRVTVRGMIGGKCSTTRCLYGHARTLRCEAPLSATPHARSDLRRSLRLHTHTHGRAAGHRHEQPVARPLTHRRPRRTLPATAPWRSRSRRGVARGLSTHRHHLARAALLLYGVRGSHQRRHDR